MWAKTLLSIQLPCAAMTVRLCKPVADSCTLVQVGFDAIDQLAQQHGLSWGRKLVHKAHTAEGSIRGARVVLCKPMAFMNVSGESVAPLAKKHGMSVGQVRQGRDEQLHHKLTWLHASAHNACTKVVIRPTLARATVQQRRTAVARGKITRCV